MAFIDATRMKVKVSKSKILVQAGRVDKAAPREAGMESVFDIVDSGISVLGKPVGTEAYRVEELTKATRAMCKSLPALTHVDPQSALALIRLCYNTRVCYLTRTAETPLLWPALGELDTKIDQAIAAIAHAEGSRIIGALRSLPESNGGLGIPPRHQSLTTEKSCTAGRASCRQHLNMYRQDLLPGTHPWVRLTNGGAREEMAYNMEVNQLDPEVATALEASLPEDDILRLAVHKRVYLGVLAELQATGNTVACATLLSSGATGTGYFLRWMGGADWRYRYRQGEFLEALRHRLLQEPFPLSGDLRCPSCPGLRFRDSP